MRLGELCAGYGGLGMAVEEVFGATTAWFSEYDEAPSRILAHHWPNVPNHGDMTKIDWAGIEHVDIISGGTPCQDLSAAGRRAGMTEGTRSNLWVQMREAIAIQKPTYVVWENVRGAYSATAASDLEQCPGCMGDTGNGGPVLRALGRVLGDLSDLGYDCQWRGLRAADVGACHGRFRVFVLAYDTRRPRRGQTVEHDGRAAATHHRASVPHESDRDPLRPRPHGTQATENPDLAIGSERRESAPGQAKAGRTRADTRGRSGTPPADAERLRGERRGIDGDLAGTPRTGETHRAERQRDGDAPHDSHLIDWGEYEPAIRRWERTLGRPAPRPTEPTGRNHGHRLSPRFCEWLMGLPDGWVTAPAIGISRNEQLKACGNGVVPAQAAAALRDMLRAFRMITSEASSVDFA